MVCSYLASVVSWILSQEPSSFALLFSFSPNFSVGCSWTDALRASRLCQGLLWQSGEAFGPLLNILFLNA